MSLPSDAAMRKAIPIYSGLAKYFPDALAAVAELSKIGNDQHNPGQDLHWAKEKSTDELDALMRHLIDGVHDPEHRDPDGVLWAVKLAWRALANLQRMADAGEVYAQTPSTEPEIVTGEWTHSEYGQEDALEKLLRDELFEAPLEIDIIPVGTSYSVFARRSGIGVRGLGVVSKALSGTPEELEERLREQDAFRAQAVFDGVPLEDALRLTKP